MATDGTAHSSALRKGRVSESNQIYVVTSVTFARRPLFTDLTLGRIVVRAFQFQQSTRRASTLAYVVMPDHFHWLLQLGFEATLSAVVQSVKTYSANRINRVRDTAGDKVWQPGFHDHAVRREEDLVAIARYVVANPLRAGLVRSVRNYSLWDAVWLNVLEG
jgi:REP element-mobilizing transposase RayT